MQAQARLYEGFTTVFDIKQPYLLFLGDAPDQLAAKTGAGIKDWRPDACVGQLRLHGCQADLGLTDMTLDDAREAGAKTLVIGVANRGGVIADSWLEPLITALNLGYDLAAGLHQKLAQVEPLAARARDNGRVLHDVRHYGGQLSVANGLERSGKRLLAVGTDCSIGKKYTALAIDKAMREAGMQSSFRATGQTGILISGGGISIDAVPADFISGAVEALSPANDADHWDVIEGQGSLYHPSFAGVSLGLLHGAQADALVLCHEPTRKHMRGLPHYPIPDIQACMDLNLMQARLTNKAAKFVGISINTAALDEAAARRYLADLGNQYSLPAVDPLRFGAAEIVNGL